MTPWIVDGIAFAALVALAVMVFGATWPSRLEFHIAVRYLKSRGLSRLVSFITVIAVLIARSFRRPRDRHHSDPCDCSDCSATR